jgi:2-polyprenyl-6-hydroxyphenyl methylase/3-demethylubiquinone-9 3-methyltransferase
LRRRIAVRADGAARREVVGADASETNIEVAKIHAAQSGVPSTYRATTSEALEARGETVRRRPQHGSGGTCCRCRSFHEFLRGDGQTRRLMFVATINRT